MFKTKKQIHFSFPATHFRASAIMGMVLLMIIAVSYRQEESVKAAPVTVNCSGTSGTPTTVDEASLAGDDVTFSDTGGDGYCALDNSISAASVVIESGVVLSHPAEDADGVTITTTGAFTINSGGQINVDQRGCVHPLSANNENGYGPNGSNVCAINTAGYGTGGNSLQGAGGGGHGGVGGDSSGSRSGGVFYDTSTAPVLFGSTGGRDGLSGAGSGGGIVRLNVGTTFTHNGVISADGGNGTAGTGAGGGGAGGSIYISTTTIAGTTGTFTATGGAGADDSGGLGSSGGGGGGGMISIDYNTDTLGLDSADFTVTGGSGPNAAADGAGGGVYIVDTAGTGGSSDDDVTVFFGFIYDDTDHSVNSWTYNSGTVSQYCATAAVTPSVTTVANLTFDGTLDCDGVTSFTLTSSGGNTSTVASSSIDSDGALTISTVPTLTLGANSTLISSGALTLGASTNFSVGSGVTITNSGEDTDTDFTIPAGNNQTWSGVTMTGAAEGDFNIDDAIAITLTGNSAINANTQWTALTTLTIDAGSSISANAKGCVHPLSANNENGHGPNGSNVCTINTAGYGTGGNSLQGGGGGGHGGTGGDSSGNIAGGTFYGSAIAPVLYGSTGGRDGLSGAGSGGGAIRLITSGTLTNNGTISSNGGNGTVATGAGGGGSGGSIYITSANFDGSGTFEAKGGDGADDSGGLGGNGGGGGGGRIAILHTGGTFSFDSGDFDLSGGSGPNAADDGVKGTVYVKNTATSRVDVYHGFTYASDYSETTWNIDSSASNQYCDSTGDTTPSVTASDLDIAGTITCNSGITSFNWDGNTTFDIGSGTTMSYTGTGVDIDFDIPAGDDQTWNNFTYTGGVQGSFTIDDAASITLTGTTPIIGNATWTNLTGLTLGSSTSINANAFGCQNVGSNNSNGYGPTDPANVCTLNTAGYGTGGNSTQGGGGGGYGGAGGASSGGQSGGTTYGSSTAPLLYGSSGGRDGLSGIGAGGGVIRLQVNGTFTNNGTLSADGGDGTVATGAGGGGSGGSIYVTANTYTCSSAPTWSADGGDGANDSSPDGGGGGGGRISVLYLTDTCGSAPLSGLVASTVAAGGSGPNTAADGSTGSLNVTQSVPTTLNCTGSAGSPTAVTESTVNSDSPISLVTFEGGGYCELDESLSVGSVLIQNNTTVTHDSEDADGVTITTTGTFQIDSGSSINVDEKGCASVTTSTAGRGPNGSNVCSVSGTGSGGDPSSVQAGGGGGHGGVGGSGSGSAAGGVTHDSATAPVLFGASGGGGFGGVASGAGGGLVRLNIGGTLTHNGTISSDGGNGLVGGGFYGTGGGAGGSIYITAGNFNGTTGTFSATGGNGGNGTSADGGGGGAGRIAITYTGGSFSLDSSDFTMTAGTGGSGAGQGNSAAGEIGTVYTQNTSTSRVDIFHGFTFDDTDHSVTTWVSDSSATNQYCNTSGGNTPSVTATDITFGGTLNCTTTQDSFNWTASNSFTFSNNASLTVVGDMTIDPATTLTMGTGVTVGVTGVDNDLEFDVPNTPQSWSGLTVNGAIEGDFTIDDAIALTLTGNSAINANAQWTNLSSLTIDSGSSISANAKGCDSVTSSTAGSGPNGSNVCSVGGTGSGGDPSSVQGGGGGGHGAVGGSGSGSAAGGVTYDSPTAPVLFGASGGGGFGTGVASGAGGGAIRLNITGTLTHNGVISANGGNGLVSGPDYGRGGGAGGSIYITAATLNGSTGTFSADGGNGGDGATADGGGGGGGRIAITYTGGSFSIDSSDFTVTAGSGGSGAGQGNSAAGEVGTVYTKDTTNSRVDIYHGFTYDDTDYSETTWVIDPSADNQYCSTSGGNTPSITATNFTFDGTLNCTTALDSFNFASTSDFNVGSGASFTITETNADFDWDIADGDDQTWTNVTITGPNEGDFTINDEIDITLSGTTTINANVQWTNLTNLTISSGTSILSDGKGCRSVSTSGDDGFGPNGSNVCSETGQGAGLDRSSVNGGGGAGHGGAGGNGNDGGGAGGTYDSSTSPVLYGASGGSGFSSAGPSGAGGGLILLDVDGTFTHNGTLSADGANGNVDGGGFYGAGAGAGGSINISADSFTCTTGTFDADGGDGGNGSSADGGGGGGGRITIQYQSETTSGACLLSAAADTVGGNGASVLVAGGSGPDAATDGSSGSIAVDLSVCGNGSTEAGEQCDDGGTVGGDGCDEQCRTEACGNGFVQNAAGEGCDDGGTTAGDGCSAGCLVEDGFNCNGEPSVCAESGGGNIESRLNPCQSIDLRVQSVFGKLDQLKGNTAVRLGWDIENLPISSRTVTRSLFQPRLIKPIPFVTIPRFSLVVPESRIFKFSSLKTTSKARVKALRPASGSEVDVVIYRGAGDVRTLARMQEIKRFPLFKDSISNVLRGYTDIINNKGTSDEKYTYAVVLANQCGKTRAPVFSKPITLPKRHFRGEAIDLNLDIQLKIKEVRDELLLDRLTNILEEHQNGNGSARLEFDRLVAQAGVNDSFSPGSELLEFDSVDGETVLDGAGGPAVNLNTAQGGIRVHRLVKDAIEAAFFPNGRQGADELLLEFFEAEKDFLQFMTFGHLEVEGFIPVDDETDEDVLKSEIESFVNQEVNLILQSFSEAEGAEDALVNALSNEGLLTLDPDDLTSLDFVTSNVDLKDTLLDIPDIDSLIKGHRDTVILEVWNEGDRTEPVHKIEVETNLFGEAQVEIKGFKTGVYDFTVRREFAVRRALNGVDVRTRNLPLDFTGASDEGLSFGDFNNDGEINLDDILKITDNFSLNPDNFDLDEDGAFNLSDVFEVIRNWGGEDTVE